MRTAYKLLVIFICLFYSLTAEAQKKVNEYQKETTSDFSFNDVHSFKSADSMYLIADTLPYSSSADLVFKTITQYIDNGRLIEKDEVWNELLKLEPYRMNPMAIDKVNIIAKKLSVLIKDSRLKFKGNLSVHDAKKHSALYTESSLDVFIKDGRGLLCRFPNNLDIRNNVALALIHKNKDLCALLELETIRNLEPLHIPALINLTVLYERLGRRVDAEMLANQLLRMQKTSDFELPQIIHNASWFMFMRENYFKADSLLTEMGMSDMRKYQNSQNLKQLSEKRYRQEMPFYKTGIMGKIGLELEKDFFRWYFIVATILIIGIFFLVLNTLFKSAEINFFLQLLFLCFILAIFYLLAWGFPASDNWFYFAGYSLLPFLLTIAIGLIWGIFSS